MNPEDRLALVQQAADTKQADLREQGRIGPPCTRCFWVERKYQWKGSEQVQTLYCGAPPAQEFQVSRVDGKVGVSSPITAETARSDGGMCGREAVMFKSRWTTEMKLTAGALAALAAVAVTQW